MPLIGHMGWIEFESAFRSSLWIVLDWVTDLMDWIGLDLENSEAYSLTQPQMWLNRRIGLRTCHVQLSG